MLLYVLKKSLKQHWQKVSIYYNFKDWKINIKNFYESYIRKRNLYGTFTFIKFNTKSLETVYLKINFFRALWVIFIHSHWQLILFFLVWRKTSLDVLSFNSITWYDLVHHMAHPLPASWKEPVHLSVPYMEDTNSHLPWLNTSTLKLI